MISWGEVYQERDQRGDVIVRCKECGAVVFHEAPHMPCAGPLTCDKCRQAKRDKTRSVNVSPRQEMRVHSGGQSGADLGALVAAKRAGLQTGGVAPLGFLTEKGPQPVLAKYSLVECNSKEYPVRTRLNIVQSDMTLILARTPLSGGSKMTLEMAEKAGKPVFVVDPWDVIAPVRICNFLLEHQPGILNVAGNRESKAPGITQKTVEILQEAFCLYQNFSSKERCSA